MSELAKLKQVHVAAAFILNEDGSKFLIAQRGAGRHLEGYWEFPGGKVEQGESAQQACCREVKEELNCQIVVDSYFLTIEHDYEHMHLSMELYICHLAKGETIECLEHKAVQFISVEQIDEIAFAPADIAILPNIKQFMHELAASKVN